MGIRIEIWPFMSLAILAGVLLSLMLWFLTPVRGSWAIAVGVLLVTVFGGYFLWFFRDPDRTPPDDPQAIIAAADGVVAKITTFSVEEFGSISMLAGLNPEDMAVFGEGDILRISIFLGI